MPVVLMALAVIDPMPPKQSGLFCVQLSAALQGLVHFIVHLILISSTLQFTVLLPVVTDPLPPLT